METGTIEILPVGDISGQFVVPSYQRGYRWGEHEVRQLLDDIRSSGGSTYYLQPLVVKARDDGSWELVDGQQRLTTLLLIFRYLRRTHLPTATANYTIRYETRPGSEAYLDELSEERAKSNIDFFHMHRAYRCIEAWFELFQHSALHEALTIYGYLFKNVRVLWYEASKDTDARDVFVRLNVGRIPLTDAELVKALLLGRGLSGPGDTDHKLEIAAYWDLIERELRTPEVWAFVTGEAGESATHISLLLDTLAGGARGRDRPLFHTFETLRPRIDKDPLGFWRDVVHLHSLVLGWHDDRSLYHKVGFLIAVGRTFDELVQLSEGRGRNSFESALDDEIRRYLGLTADEVAELTFASRKTSDALLLMNVETIRRMKHSSERYSFRSQAAGGWSLEHIHAQSAEALNKAEQWKEWLEYHQSALKTITEVDDERRTAVLARIKELLTSGVVQQQFSVIEPEVIALLSPTEEGDGTEIHSISNLALLARDDNAALNNSVFEVKRRKMIERDKGGSFIPVCTRNVFLKYYGDPSDQQPYFWSSTDRLAYLKAIQCALAPYVTPDEFAP